MQQKKDLQTKQKLENDEVCFPGQIILFRIRVMFLHKQNNTLLYIMLYHKVSFVESNNAKLCFLKKS